MKDNSQLGEIGVKNKFLLVLSVVILLSFPNVNFGQAPDLGTSSSFALFTSSGAFGNIGNTNINGNIGTNLGDTSGFVPATVVGNIYVVDSTSAQVATDVDTAYNQLGRIKYDSVIGDTMGKGQVLNAKAYYLGGASVLLGNLILDGQDNPDALFIFKINGALSTYSLSNIILINSASLYNVYWRIDGAFSLGDSSVFRGTIIANGAISLLDSSSLLGRGLTRAGAISLHNNNVGTTSNPLPLPITLVSFNAKKCNVNSCVKLTWQTASESNSANFLIERSINGINFNSIGERNAAGNSSQLRSYLFTDEEPAEGINYYRLNQFDLNGLHKYSPVEAVSISDVVLPVSIYPNPFTVSVDISINVVSQIQNCELKIYNVLGAEVLNTVMTEQITTLETSNLPSGNYFYNVISNGKTIQSGKLISQR